ncbi:hypothetical protein AARI_01610 [Glutamicibacter arilaitensis Re117]|uniref:Uncharacterized protein n=1 Tax=Glutamicibacter arilaitensis (strain DSM 16368 / CIP 108037 / IAM 15318 / JCM 13566 / NCIMB 14258 / Re117) TaxID=861360 RepID=A0ABM9PT80_GLUAR|nr:hypothetical protein AARI_01610 [Glutamicibacter arilaitensis Re117]
MHSTFGQQHASVREARRSNSSEVQLEVPSSLKEDSLRNPLISAPCLGHSFCKTP